MSGYNYGTGPSNCDNGNCPEQVITAPTKTQYEHIYKKQPVQVIHPIEIVRKYHCCPVYHHSYVYSVRDEFENPLAPDQPLISSYRNKNLKKKSAAGRKAAASRKASVSSARAKMKSKAVSKSSGSKLRSKPGSKFASKSMKKR
ncbi:hypothetical protein [Paenibacillus medicaginis]|uniref:Uncharacterized protein n=1 Tax=Paenibacillus medicaginis TaxID=1470560 RepID=A0ABV5C6T0_9BACL